MFNLPTQNQPNISLLSPTVFELEDAHYAEAKAFASAQTGDEHTRWSAYLNMLGVLSFRDWLADRNAVRLGSLTQESAEAMPTLEGDCHIQFGEFLLAVHSAEHFLSEQITLSQAALETPEQAAHFYILLEVAEEQSEVWFRGFMRRDQLLQVAQPVGENVVVSLDAFELEPSRLLSYCLHLDASDISLPQLSSTPVNPAQRVDSALATVRTQLSQWFDDVVDQGWMVWDALQPQVAYATRSLGADIKCGKLVHLEMQVDENPLALVLTLTPQADDKANEKINEKTNEKISVLVQLLPTGRDRTLLPNIQLSLISKKGRTLQTTTSHSRDNYIQLKSFKGKAGMQFSLKVQLDDAIVTENFEI